nr:MAG: hypothetical protein [Bacteriophage sp.]
MGIDTRIVIALVSMSITNIARAMYKSLCAGQRD